MSFLENMRFGCDHCHQQGKCAATCENPETCDGSPIDSGPSLVLPSITVFLLPLASGIAGAYLGGRWGGQSAAGASSAWQGAGLLAGLAVGVLVARMLVARWRRVQARPVGDEG